MRLWLCGKFATMSLALLLSACQGMDGEGPVSTRETNQTVVYGEDDRTDEYAHSDESLRAITRQSIAALIPPSALDMSDPADITIRAATLRDAFGLCDDQRFLDQPTAASCSATLIDDDLVLTAGHCVDGLSECRGFRYVFDYYYEAPGELATITSDDVYECQDLVVQTLTNQVDYAIVQLDRPVSAPHQPVAVRPGDEPMGDMEPVVVIGFGSGLPAKIDDGGRVLDARASQRDYFVASVDTFGGNSGSGVLDASGEVVGVLVRGETDYVQRDGCFVVNELPDPPDPGVGEDVTYVARAIEDLCENAVFPSARLCGGPTGEGWCDPCGSPADCPEGWACRGLPDLTGSYCALGCEGDSDCRDDHHCSDDGFCEPDRRSQCFGGDVWEYDACQRQVGLIQSCGADGFCSDASCVARPGGDTCNSATLIPAKTQTLSGDLSSGFLPDYEGLCAGSGPERVYRFEVTEPSTLTAVATGFDTVLYLRTTCDDPSSEQACNDDATPPGDLGSRLTARLDLGTYFLFMDAWGTDVGTYELQLTFEPQGEVPDGDACANATVIASVSQVLSGDLGAGYVDDYRGSCGGFGPERVYRFSVTEPIDLTVDSAGFDTLLYARSTCEGQPSEIACNDDASYPDDLGSHIATRLQSGTYFLFMDAYDQTVGDYTLALDFQPVCSSSCSLGARRCQGDAVEVCEIDADGCATWRRLDPCPQGTVCVGGECISECVDECAPAGARECAGEATLHICGDFDGDPCLEWGQPASCPVGESCLGGDCVPMCTDACGPAGLMVCAGDRATRTCGDFDDDACLEWGAPVACLTGELCTEGACTCIDPCSEGERRCSGSVVQVCTGLDSACPRWIDRTDCEEAGQLCVDGECVATCTGACALGDRRCAEDASGSQVCGMGPEGCAVWSEVAPCPEGEQCVGDGVCEAVCYDDGFEPNDTPEQALYVGPGELADLLVCAVDEDWLAVALEDDVELVVEAEFDPDSGNLDLELYSDDGLELLDGSYGDTGKERVAVAVGEGADVLVRILLADGDANAYDLFVDVVPLGASACLPGERRCSEDRGGVEKCVDLDGDGRFEWSEAEPCGPGFVCEEPGECRASLGPLPDVGGAQLDVGGTGLVPEPGRGEDGGCGCSAGQGRVGTWGLGWLAGGLALLGVRRRRRGSGIALGGHIEDFRS